MLPRSCFLITLIKCLKGHKSLGSLCNVKSKSYSVTDWLSQWQGHLLSCCGQLKTEEMVRGAFSKTGCAENSDGKKCVLGTNPKLVPSRNTDTHTKQIKPNGLKTIDWYERAEEQLRQLQVPPRLFRAFFRFALFRSNDRSTCRENALQFFLGK